MNLLISADMEGISGVVVDDHTSSSHAECMRFRKLMTAEVNAAIEGMLAGLSRGWPAPAASDEYRHQQ